MADGFYLMHRGWQDNPAFNDEPFSRRDAWVWLIENANFAPGKVGVKGKTVAVGRGQLCYSLRYMAKAWKWDEARVRRFLARLEADAMIRSVTDAGQTLITVCNYDEYQAPERVADATPDAAPTQQRRDADANQNEGNKGKNNTEANASGAGAPDDARSDKDRVWGAGLTWLAREADTNRDELRSLVGKWIKDHGAARVWQLMADGMAQPVPIFTPVEWMCKALQNRKSPDARHASSRKPPGVRVGDEREHRSAFAASLLERVEHLGGSA